MTTAAHQQIYDSIRRKSSDRGASLSVWLAEQTDDKLPPWLSEIDKAIEGALSSNEMPSIKDLVVHKDGARKALHIALKGLGSKHDLQKHKYEIEKTAQLYFKWLGFSRTNLLLVNNIGYQAEVVDEPDKTHAHYKLGHQTLKLLNDELSAISKGEAKPLSNSETAGALIASLALRDGALTSAEIRRALIEIHERRLINAGPFWYVAGPIASDGTHYRRLHLSKLSVCFSFNVAIPSTKPENLNKFISTSLASLGQRLQITAVDTLKLKSLLTAGQHYLRFQAEIPQHVIDYAQGITQSDSLAESCWARLLSLSPTPETLSHEIALKQAREARVASPITRPGLIQRLTQAFGVSKSHKVVNNTVLELITDEKQKNHPPLLLQLLDWVEWMLTINGIKPSTAKNHLSRLSRLLFANVQSLNSEIKSPDAWEALYEQMLFGSKEHDKALDAVKKMSDFLAYRYDTDFGHAGFSSQALVNAWVISEGEMKQAIDSIKRDLIESDPNIVELANHLIPLALYLGLRRGELLGLEFRDVRGVIEPMLVVRDNDHREVKTDSSNRQVPLSLVKDEPFYNDWRQQCRLKDGAKPSDNILEANDFDIQKREAKLFHAISKALQDATRSKEVSFHTLRHSCICRLLLALYWPSLHLKGLEQFPYFQEIAARSDQIRKILVRKSTEDFFEHKTVSALAGHLSFGTTAGHYFHFYCLMRSGYLAQVNEKSVLPESNSVLTGSMAKVMASEKSLSLDDLFQDIAAEHQDKWICYQAAKTRANDYISSELGKELKTKVKLVSELYSIGASEREKRLAELVPDDKKRLSYLSGQQARSDYIEDLFRKRKQHSKREGSVFIMPTDVPSQKGINVALDAIDQSCANNPERTALAMRLLEAAKHYSANDTGTFIFKRAHEVAAVLNPVLDLLKSSDIELKCWCKYSVKVNGSPRKQIENEQVIESLDQLTSNYHGNVLVRIRAKAGTDLYAPRILKWIICAMYVTYGKTPAIAEEPLKTVNKIS